MAENLDEDKWLFHLKFYELCQLASLSGTLCIERPYDFNYYNMDHAFCTQEVFPSIINPFFSPDLQCIFFLFTPEVVHILQRHSFFSNLLHCLV